MTERILSHKIRMVKLSNVQQNLLDQAFGTRRFVYNQAKAISDAHYEETGKTLGKFDLRNRIVREVKPEHPWVRDMPKSIIEEAAFDYRQSLAGFFTRVRVGKAGNKGIPGFLAKGKAKDTFTVNKEQFKVEGRRLTITKIGVFRLAENLRWDGDILSLTVTRKGDRVFATVQVRVEYQEAAHTGAVVGVDQNLHNVALSDGTVLDRLSPLRSSLVALRAAQKRLSRTEKGSRNRVKAKRRVARIHARISDQREDAIKKLCSRIVLDNSIISIEDLNVRGMMSNRRLSRSLADASFHKFTQTLLGMSELEDRTIVKVGRYFPSSKKCSSCDAVKAKLSLSERVYRCEKCGIEIDRDVNAAINIRDEGERILGLTESDPRFSGTSMPAEHT